MHSFSRSRSYLLVVLGVLACTAAADSISTRSQATLAQIGSSTPLPVYVTNEGNSLLPEGFVVGTRWRFTTWSAPTTISFVGTVQATTGPWANLSIQATDGTMTTRWFNVPAMPGGWEKQ